MYLHNICMLILDILLCLTAICVIIVPQGIVSKYTESFFTSSYLPVIGSRIDLNGHQSLLDDPSFPGQH